MIHILHWFINFLGVNFGENKFSTHMYNFWSGFGADITEFALIGTLIAIYRNHIKNTKILNGVLKDVVHGKDLITHRKKD